MNATNKEDPQNQTLDPSATEDLSADPPFDNLEEFKEEFQRQQHLFEKNFNSLFDDLSQLISAPEPKDGRKDLSSKEEFKKLFISGVEVITTLTSTLLKELKSLLDLAADKSKHVHELQNKVKKHGEIASHEITAFSHMHASSKAEIARITTEVKKNVGSLFNELTIYITKLCNKNYNQAIYQVLKKSTSLISTYVDKKQRLSEELQEIPIEA